MFSTIGEFVGQNWLSTTISVLAIAFAVYEARRRRGPRLAYQFTGQRLIGARRDRLPTGVEIRFQGTQLPNLTKSQIVVWNKGDGPLRNADVPAHDPIVFSFGEGTRVFIADVARITREVNVCEVAYESGVSSGVVFKFDFLDRNDGALLQIWHDSRDAVPEVSGTVLGQKEGLVSYGRFVVYGRNIDEPPKFSGSFEKVAYTVGKVLFRRGLMRAMPVVIALWRVRFPKVLNPEEYRLDEPTKPDAGDEDNSRVV